MAVIWLFLLSIVGNSGVAALEGSKSIKIRQCNDNLAVVDQWPLFRGAVIEEFHCSSFKGHHNIREMMRENYMFNISIFDGKLRKADRKYNHDVLQNLEQISTNNTREF